VARSLAQPIASPVNARVDGLHHALSVVAGLGGAPADNVRVFPVDGHASRLAEDLSERITAASAAGLEAIAALRDAGLDANPAAARALADMIRDGLVETVNPMLKKIAALKIPVVAAVNGPAAGAGAPFALHADFVIAGASAFFYFAFC